MKTKIRMIGSGQSASLEPTRSALAHGYGVFETMRLCGGRLAFWDAHWARLVRSANALGLPCDCEPHAVLDGIRELVGMDDLDEATIKLSLLERGDGSELLIYARPGQPVPESVSLQMESRYPVNERSLLAGHKTHNYLENMWLLQRARERGFTDVVRVNTRGYLAETTVANLFWLSRGRLQTPALSCGVLPGVVRSAILGLHPVAEGEFAPEVLDGAEAVFLTNATVGILPVDRIDGEGGTFQANALPGEVVELKRALAAHALECSVTL